MDLEERHFKGKEQGIDDDREEDDGDAVAARQPVQTFD
jgi:hypothetical protein